MLNEENKRQVNVDFTNFPDLFDGLTVMVEKQGVNRSILIRNLVKQAWEEYQHMEALKTRVQPKIKQVARS